jgi:hypothetical protein
MRFEAEDEESLNTYRSFLETALRTIQAEGEYIDIERPFQ